MKDSVPMTRPVDPESEELTTWALEQDRRLEGEIDQRVMATHESHAATSLREGEDAG